MVASRSSSSHIVSYRTGSSIRIYPLKDQLETILNLLLGPNHGYVVSSSSYQKNGGSPSRSSFSNGRSANNTYANAIKTVYVLFEEPDISDDNHLSQQVTRALRLSQAQYLTLFDALGNCLPNLESVIIRKIDDSSAALAGAVPPIPALTSLLRGDNPMKYLTLIGLDLLGDTYDMNGLREAIRIHRGLHSFVMKSCSLASEEHITIIQEAIDERPDMKHRELLDTQIKTISSKSSKCGWVLASIVVALLAVGFMYLYEQVLQDQDPNNAASMILQSFSSSMIATVHTWDGFSFFSASLPREFKKNNKNKKKKWG